MLFVLRVVHLAAQANQLALLVGAAFMAARPLADVLRLAMNIRNQRSQLLLEENANSSTAPARIRFKRSVGRPRHPGFGNRHSPNTSAHSVVRRRQGPKPGLR